MKKALYETLTNIADNTLSDNSMSNFLIRNLAANIGISTGAANSRVGKLEAFAFVRTEKIGQGVLVAVTESGRAAIINDSPEERSPRKPRLVGTKKSDSTLPDGYVLLSSFVKSASSARRKLRKLNEPKPCSQWAWPTSEIERIKKLIGDI